MNAVRLIFAKLGCPIWAAGTFLLVVGAPLLASAQVDIGVGTTETKSVVTDYGGNLVIQPDGSSFSDGVLNIGQDIGTNLGYGTLILSATGTINADFPTVSGNFSLVDIGQGAANGVNTSSGTGTLNQTGGIFYGPATLVIGDGNGNGSYTMTGGSFVSPVNVPGSHIYVGLTESSYSQNGSIGNLTIGGSASLSLGSSAFLDVGRSENDNPTYAGGSGSITQTGGTANYAGAVFIGSEGAGTGTYTLSGGSANYTSGFFAVGSGASTDQANLGKTAVGVFNQSGGTFTTSVGTGFVLGGYGSGTYTLTGTGTGTFNGSISLAQNAGSVGTINLNGGTFQIGGTNGITSGSGTAAFNLGGGLIQVINSSLTTSVPLTLTGSTTSGIDTNGFNATFSGGVNNDGLNNSKLIKIGTGTLEFDGASNTISSFFVIGGNFNQTTGTLTSNEVGVGSGVGSTGTYTMTAGSLVFPTGTVAPIVNATANSFRVGDFGGTGTFLQSGGSVIVNGSLNVGNQGGHGTYSLSGGSLNLESGLSTLGRTSGGSLSSGGSTGTFNLSGTGTVNVDGTSAFVLSNWYPYSGGGAQGTGVLNQTGGSIIVANTASLQITGFGSSIYNLKGGTLQIGGSSLIGVFGGENGSYQFNLGGGTIQVKDSNLVTDVEVTLTGSTTSTINTNGFNATFSGQVKNDGLNNSQLVKVGAGTLEFDGASNSVTSFFVNGGSFNQTTGTLTSYEVGVGSGLGNTGSYTISGGSLVIPSGTVPPIVGATAASFRVGDFGGTGTFLQSGGSVIVNGSLNVGNQGGHGTYSLSGGSLNLESGLSTLGRTSGGSLSSGGSTGTFNLSGTGTVNVDGTSAFVLSNWYPYSGGGAQGTGVLNQTGGSIIVANTASLRLTGFGSSVYNLKGGTLQIGGSSLIGVFGGENGTYQFNLGGGTIQVKDSNLVTDVNLTLTGSTSSTINTNGLNATFSGEVNNDGLNNAQLVKIGAGNLEFDGASNSISSFYVNGGTFTQTTGTLTSYEVGVGSGLGNTGTYTMSGGSLVLPAGAVPAIVGGPGTFASFRVGDFGGTGTFIQSAGTVTVHGALDIGNQGGHGIYQLSGGSLNLESGQSALGRTSGSSSGSTGELDISGAGQLNVDGTYEFIGSNWYPTSGSPQGSGVINQTGGTVTVANTAKLYLTGFGSGTYNLNGGTLNIGGNSLVGTFGGENGTYHFNLGGGTIKVKDSNLVTGVNATLTGTTTSTINTNGFNASLSGSLTGTGGLAKTGSGTLILTSNGSTYSGGTTVSAGALIANNTLGSATGSGSLTVTSGATIGGTGCIAPTAFDISGNVQVGNGVDTTSGFTLSNSGTSTFTNATLQFNIEGLAGESNTLHVGSGTIDFSNTTVAITFGGYPLTDSLYTLIDNGTGSSTYSGLSFGGTDSHGYTIITGGLSLTYSNGSYLFLNGGTIGLSEVAVPEPTTLPLIFGGLAALYFLRRKRSAVR